MQANSWHHKFSISICPHLVRKQTKNKKQNKTKTKNKKKKIADTSSKRKNQAIYVTTFKGIVSAYLESSGKYEILKMQ